MSLTLVTAKNESSFRLNVKYGGRETELGIYYTQAPKAADIQGVKAKILTEDISIGKVVEVEVSSHRALHYYSYLIVSRGVIVESRTIKVEQDPENVRFSDTFKFIPTFKHAPQPTIIVYALVGEEIMSTKVSFSIYENLQNFIDLSVTPEAAKPGHIVDIEVKSNPKSYIGLLGIDQSVLLLRGGNDLSYDDVWNELEMFYTQISYRKHSFSFGEATAPEKKKKKKTAPIYNNHWEDFSVGSLGILFSITKLTIVSLYRFRAVV